MFTLGKYPNLGTSVVNIVCHGHEYNIQCLQTDNVSMAAEYACCSMTSQNIYSYAANKKRWTLTTANRMLRNCQEDILFCYDIRGKSYDKYDPCFAVPRR